MRATIVAMCGLAVICMAMLALGANVMAEDVAWNLFTQRVIGPVEAANPIPRSTASVIDFNVFDVPAGSTAVPESSTSPMDVVALDFNPFVFAAEQKARLLPADENPLLSFARAYRGVRYHATDGRTTKQQLQQHYGFDARALAPLSEQECTAVLGGVVTEAFSVPPHDLSLAGQCVRQPASRSQRYVWQTICIDGRCERVLVPAE